MNSGGAVLLNSTGHFVGWASSAVTLTGKAHFRTVHLFTRTFLKDNDDNIEELLMSGTTTLGGQALTFPLQVAL